MGAIADERIRHSLVCLRILEELSIEFKWSSPSWARSRMAPQEVQALASKLKKYDWRAVKAAGVELDEVDDYKYEWLGFRHLVIDAARTCNALEWEADD